MKRIFHWIEKRSGMYANLKAFGAEPIPKSVGWRNTLGSLAGALILLQVLSGLLLALYYVPHPDAAYASLEYINTHIGLGEFVRSLHYWGSSFIVVALFIHTLRVFYSGAYRKPRELNWLVGLALFGIVLALAFTGQFLPYNQMGYWAANVGIEIASAAPIIGPKIKTLLMGGDQLGALTLTRFYAMHIVVLPAFLGVLVTFHLYLLRKHGPMRSLKDTSTDTEPFFPKQLLRDLVTISLGLTALAATAMIIRGPHSGPLDFTDTSYVPKPEWYFMSHYELLRFTPPALYTVATFYFPNLLFIFLALLPWLDKAKGIAPKERPVIFSLGTFTASAIIGLTLIGILNHQPESGAEGPVAQSEEAFDPDKEKLRLGRAVYSDLQCAMCHRINKRGKQRGPELDYIGDRLQEDYLRQWLRDPEKFMPDTIMPSIHVGEDKFDALVFYLMSHKSLSAP
jgi:ubiquinol-cytochrome c reductase cytochrome b subunit